ncbi:MAG TPA: serine/threonine-protein kinase, partial [Pirellulaceae bacterium]|nr:serine/threonine-protein kinase [Pirellulaceae bacterium]
MDLTLDNALATWDLLEKHLSAFIAAWEQGLTPAIGDHLPQGTGSLRRLALIELIKADLDYRFASGEGWLLEKYVEAFPELATPAGPPCDLIYEEFHVRRSKGYVVSREEFFTRFPGRREELERLLGAVDASQSTALLAEKQLIHLQEGDQIDDFDLLARVGQGAFGSVFLARQRSISRLVALKVSADRGQEARMLAQLDHPNIVRVYDQRRLPERQLRLVYMQFASGGTLADLVERARGSLPQDRSGAQLVSLLEESLERRGLGPMVDPSVLRSLVKLAWPEVVCRLGAQLAQALDYAHRQGVLHRDVKPANILLAADGTPKLADFNISSLASHPNVGAAAYFGGSLAYMSPEHLEAFNPQHPRQAEELDGRADLYSLAVVLWELLCGKKPFTDARVSEDWSET